MHRKLMQMIEIYSLSFLISQIKKIDPLDSRTGVSLALWLWLVPYACSSSSTLQPSFNGKPFFPYPHLSAVPLRLPELCVHHFLHISSFYF